MREKHEKDEEHFTEYEEEALSQECQADIHTPSNHVRAARTMKSIPQTFASDVLIGRGLTVNFLKLLLS